MELFLRKWNLNKNLPFYPCFWKTQSEIQIWPQKNLLSLGFPHTPLVFSLWGWARPPTRRPLFPPLFHTGPQPPNLRPSRWTERLLDKRELSLRLWPLLTLPLSTLTHFLLTKFRKTKLPQGAVQKVKGSCVGNPGILHLWETAWGRKIRKGRDLPKPPN